VLTMTPLKSQLFLGTHFMALGQVTNGWVEARLAESDWSCCMTTVGGLETWGLRAGPGPRLVGILSAKFSCSFCWLELTGGGGAVCLGLVCGPGLPETGPRPRQTLAHPSKQQRALSIQSVSGRPADQQVDFLLAHSSIGGRTRTTGQEVRLSSSSNWILVGSRLELEALYSRH